jgi:hypothetical protein
MARSAARNTKKNGKTNSRNNDTVPPEVRKPNAGELKHPLTVAVDAMFQNDASVRNAIADNLRTRSEVSRAISARAKTAFENFDSRRIPINEVAGRNYIAPGADLTEVQRSVINKGLAAMKSSAYRPAITLHKTVELKSRIQADTDTDSEIVGTVDLGQLVDLILSKPNVSPANLYSLCQAELDAEEILKKIEGVPETANGGAAVGNGTAGTSDAETLVKKTVNVQMDTLTSPESEVRYSSIPNSADKNNVQGSIVQTFELRPGASDVTSYHDFNTLQIAFEHVWSRIFDGQLTSLGQELFHEYVKLKEFTGSTDPDPTISTLDDLKNLLDEIKYLSNFAETELPATTPKAGDNAGRGAPRSPEDIVQAVKDTLPYNQLANAIGDETVAAVIDPAGFLANAIINLLSGKSQITWDSFLSQQPPTMGPFKITATFEENAAPAGEVAIVLSTQSPSPWVGIDFQEIGNDGNITNHFKISSGPNDQDVWDRSSYNVLPLYTNQLAHGVLEFDGEAEFGLHHGYYLLAGLEQKIKDRTRVTFTWVPNR